MPQPSERAVAAARKVLAKIAAYDPHFPNFSQSTLMAWAEHITISNMTEDDMLDGVTKFYETATAGAKPLPASITILANAIRIERIQREPKRAREEREARRDAKLEGREYVKELDPPGGKMSMAEWEERHGVRFPKVALGLDIPDGPKPLSVRCPWCRRDVGYRCVIPGSDTELKGPSHNARMAVLEGRCAGYAGFHVNPHSSDCERGMV